MYEKNFDDRKGKETEGFMHNVLLLLPFYYCVVGEEIPRGHLGHEDPPAEDQSEVS